MPGRNDLQLDTIVPLKAQNAGLFISRGSAHHPTRVLGNHELILVKQGELDMFEDEQTFCLRAGQTLHLWPGRRHGSTKPMPPNLRFYWIHFDLVFDTSVEALRAIDQLAPTVNIPQVAQLAEPERLERLFLTFLEDQETSKLNPFSANLLTLLMLNEVAHAHELKTEIHDSVSVVATWANTYVMMNYDRPISTRSVAEALGFNADYLGRIYRQAYGQTLTEAIHLRRVKVACKYLLDSKTTIQQIAQKCGYTDPDYFRRIFRRYMQVSPNDYRAEFSHLHVNTL
ncbi:MAG: helix-turn-helix transcriptional regulator [Chloroflexi bacterium]|nr:helix-turn-helix transcriptional regulator [Chloroflexota bacterium]